MLHTTITRPITAIHTVTDALVQLTGTQQLNTNLIIYGISISIILFSQMAVLTKVKQCGIIHTDNIAYGE